MHETIVHDVYVGIGSNIDPSKHLRDALEALECHFAAPVRSSLYRSPPYGFSGADFLNMVVVFASGEGPEAVEAVLSKIESEGGRALRRQGSRTLDLDLLLYGQRVDARRRLPREDVLRYPFVLAPLAEIAAHVAHPVTGERFDAAWRAMAAGEPPLERLGPVEHLTTRRCARRPPR